MKRNFFRLLLSAVLMMCCTTSWALHGERGGTYVDKYGEHGCDFDLYTDYSYTYEGVTKSFSGKCAVVTRFYNKNSTIHETITKDGVTYTVVAIGEDVVFHSSPVGGGIISYLRPMKIGSVDNAHKCQSSKEKAVSHN